MATEFMNQALHYHFEKKLTDYQVWKLLNLEKADGYEHDIAELQIGYVKIVAVAYCDGDKYSACYDVYVKDEPTAPDWVFYESVYTHVNYESFDFDKEMLDVLMKFLKENDLSYSACSFRRKEGIRVKKNEGR